jgi:hypothetical protein
MVPETPLCKIVLDGDTDQIVSASDQLIASRIGPICCPGRGGAEWRWVDFELGVWGRAAPCGVWVGQGECVRARAF